MITIKNETIRKQKNFWNNCLFHPTDAVEDAWGKRILDRIAEDKAVKTVRIYTMFEDIVLMDESGKLTYDFRVNDLRLDYLVEKGYNLLLAYGMMSECIAANKNATANNSKNKTRYKGKLINTSTPVDYKLWEEICYEYTRHIIDRYGIETVSKWHIQCFNEPDIPEFFLSNLPADDTQTRLREYCKLYTAFADGVLRASDKVCFGGPALAFKLDFLGGFLDYVKENNQRLDFISIHNYAGLDSSMYAKGLDFSVNRWIDKQQKYVDVIKEHGFSDVELIIDEWGMAGHGFFNLEECPPFIARENEVFSSYFVKLIWGILKKGWKVSKLMICLSGQHEMVTDFSGFRNFFTLNFFAKPIYNAYILASKLYENLIDVKTDNENIFVIPTKDDSGRYAVLLTYSSECFKEDLPQIKEEITYDGCIKGRKATVYCIDKNTTNPYRLYQRKGISNPSDADIKELRQEGTMKPIAEYTVSDKIELDLTANSVYMIMID